MKHIIAIITWLGQGNYGTTLQAYALRQTIEKLGYKPVFPLTFNVSFLYKIKRLILRLLHSKKQKRTSPKKGLKYDKLYKHLESYNILQIKNKAEYNKMIKDIPVFMTGSDQIWNTNHSYDPFYFLNFAKNRKRVAYASSIGTNHIPNKYRRKVKHHLIKFQHIGVRENSAVDELSRLTGRTDIVQVVDPTFLLSKSDWNELTKEACIEFTIPDEYILCYFIGNNEQYSIQLENIKKTYGIKHIIAIPSEEHPMVISSPDIFVYQDAGPAEFVHLIQCATLVCTDSFHATALSINFNIDFVEFLRFSKHDSKSQNTRIYDLLQHYQLSERIYNPETELWSTRIDYIQVNEILEKDRANSLQYLSNSISISQNSNTHGNM